MSTTVPHRTLKERQREERERLILQAAKEALLEKGYHDMSMDEIAARVGIAKGTLYLHFARKEQLVCALFENELLSILHTVEQLNSTAGSVQEKLERIIRTVYQISQRRAQLFFTLHNNIELIALMKEQQCSSVFQTISQHIASLLNAGKANGEFDNELPTEVMLHTFFSMLSPRSYRHLIIDKHMDSDEVIRSILRIYMRGIGAASPRNHQ